MKMQTKKWNARCMFAPGIILFIIHATVLEEERKNIMYNKIHNDVFLSGSRLLLSDLLGAASLFHAEKRGKTGWPRCVWGCLPEVTSSPLAFAGSCLHHPLDEAFTTLRPGAPEASIAARGDV